MTASTAIQVGALIIVLKQTLKELHHWVVGAGPLVRQMADEIGLIELINRMVTWDPIRTKVSPGERIIRGHPGLVAQRIRLNRARTISRHVRRVSGRAPVSNHCRLLGGPIVGRVATQRDRTKIVPVVGVPRCALGRLCRTKRPWARPSPSSAKSLATRPSPKSSGTSVPARRSSTRYKGECPINTSGFHLPAPRWLRRTRPSGWEHPCEADPDPWTRVRVAT